MIVKQYNRLMSVRFVTWAALLGGLAVALVAPAGVVRADEDEEDKIPDPETITLRTEDNVIIKATYYGSLEGKEAVPVIMLHGWEGNRGQFDGLASELQEKGCAVVTVDLRGHGDSTVQRRPDRGTDITLSPDSMNRTDILKMAAYDLKAVRDFLYDKNNEGQLNIDALCVVAAEQGCVVAANWAFVDWSARVFPYDRFKRGQWTKAMVLISPVRNFKGATMNQPLGHRGVQQLPAMIAVGERDRKANSEAQKLVSQLERFQARSAEKQIYFIPLDSSLQGTKLLDKPTLKLNAYVYGFVRKHVMAKMEDNFPWLERERR